MSKYSKLHLAGALVMLGGASSFQIASNDQVPLGGSSVLGRPLVDTEALQASISSENLLSRAKELYEVAKLGEAEFNHPTRVIGSKGR